MRLNTNQHEVAGSGFQAVSDFRVEVNAKTFKVLSDTIYKDKIGSIVRELSCNAFDSHIMAKKSDVPFEIHLPDAFEPYFSIRDFGTGISAEDIIKVYTAYFSSTKDQSNDEVGAFGLGSKTPFAYTDAFTVISIHNGIKTMYNAHVNNGLPAIVAYGESVETDEPNGLEVNVGVESIDHKKFASAVKKQLHFFPVKPTIINGEVKWDAVEPTLQATGFTYFKNNSARQYYYNRSDDTITGLYLKQGPVGYPVDFDILDQFFSGNTRKPSAFYEYLKSNASSYNACLVVDMPIGTVEVTASREGISYSDVTINNILTKFDSIADQIFNTVSAKLDAAYATSPAEFFKVFTTLDSYFLSTVKASELNKRFKRFLFCERFSGAMSIRYRVPSSMKNVLFEQYDMTGFSKPKVSSRNVPTRIDESDDKSGYAINASWLFNYDYMYNKNIKTNFIGRMSEDCDEKHAILITLEGTDIDAFNKWVKNSVELTSLEALPIPTSSKRRGGNGGHSITGGRQRMWFGININRHTRFQEGFEQGFSTLYRLNFPQIFAEDIEELIEDGVTYAYFTTHGNKVTGFDGVNSEEMISFVSWLNAKDDYNVIAITKTMEKALSDDDRFVNIKGLWDDRENTFYTELLNRFGRLVKEYYYGRFYNNFYKRIDSYRLVHSMESNLEVLKHLKVDVSSIEDRISQIIGYKEHARHDHYSDEFDRVRNIVVRKFGTEPKIKKVLEDVYDGGMAEYENMLTTLNQSLPVKLSKLVDDYRKVLFDNAGSVVLRQLVTQTRDHNVQSYLLLNDPINNGSITKLEDVQKAIEKGLDGG